MGTGAARCPAHCPLKQKSRCFNNTFRYTVLLNDSVPPDVYFYADGAAERAQKDEAKAPSVSASLKQEDVLKNAETLSSTRASAPTPMHARTRTQEPTPAREPSVIGYDASFLDEPADEPIGKRIGYDASFLDEPADEPIVTRSTKRTLDKYNDLLTTEESLFANVRTRRPDEPCFADGGYIFYERAPSGVSSAGNSASALRYIFQHWYVSRVFKEEGKSFKEEFLYLLKLRGFKEKESELKSIVEDVKTDVNGKFFRLFYGVIYKNQINAFYFGDGDSPFRKLSARFLDREDFYEKLTAANNPTEFLASFEPCFDELTAFLQAGESAENGREWFKRNIPLAVAEKTGQAVFVDETEGKLSLVNLGSIRKLVADLCKPATVEVMAEKYRFLKEFRVTVNYKIARRSKPLELSSTKTKEDDGVYDVLGLSGAASSQCATAYNYYATLVKEYADVFHPDAIVLGDCCFTCRNFYDELVNTITGACAHFTGDDAKTYPEVKKLYLAKSFFDRGIFEYFESRCETDKLPRLKKVFLEADELNMETYFRFDGVKHWVTDHGERKTVSAYLAEAATRGKEYLIGMMGSDKIFKAYFAAKTTAADWKVASGEIDRMLSDQRKLIEEM